MVTRHGAPQRFYPTAQPIGGTPPSRDVLHADAVEIEHVAEMLDERATDRALTVPPSLGSLRASAHRGDLRPIEPDDVHDLSRAYPPHDLADDQPVSEDALVVAGAMVELFERDQDAYALALTTATKKIHYEGDRHRYDQNAAGLTAEALAQTAGTSHGSLPARMIYRVRPATWRERLGTWGRDRWSPGLLPRWLRPGPDEVGEDISLWYIARSTWHYLRIPSSGVPQTVARTDIPCDMPPEQTLGDDWKVIERIPLLRSKQGGFSVIRTDVDQLAAAMGYRTRFGGLILPELLNMILDSRKATRKVAHNRKRTKGMQSDGSIEREKTAPEDRGFFASLIIGAVKFAAVAGFMVIVAALIIAFGDNL